MSSPEAAAPASGRQSAVQWIALLSCSAAIGAVFAWMRVPAALLLGPMLAGIATAASGGTARVPNAMFLLAQGIIGCMIAKMAPLAIAGEILSRWPVFVFGVLAVIAVSTSLGWWMTRMRILPGTAALWGSSPGAAMAMVVMAEAHGADGRLVAFMQYLRIAIVAAGASTVAHVWNLNPSHTIASDPAHVIASIVWFPRLHWLPVDRKSVV